MALDNTSNNNEKEKITKVLSLRKKINSDLVFLVALFSGVLLIISTYAWLSVSLDVKVNFFDMKVSSDSGLFISLDGVDFGESIEVSMNSIITELKENYPDHTNQWSVSGLWPVSSNGTKDNDSDRFDVFKGELSRRKAPDGSRLLQTIKLTEERAASTNIFISFDIFLKNVSGSPNPDNLFLGDNTMVYFDADVPEEDLENMTGILNSIRIGFLKMSSVSNKADVQTIQNITCEGMCETVIFEPYYLNHSDQSILLANENYGITLEDGVYTPTYAIIEEGKDLILANGHEETMFPLDTEHFAKQETATDIVEPIFQLPNAITKMRVVIWLEGQDLDSLETNSDGAGLNLSIDFIKDLAGYE